MQIEEFNLLVQGIQDKLYRLALRVVRNEEEAMDVVQEALMKVWTKREKLAEIENKEAYTMTIARNVAIDKIRARKMSTSDIDEHYDIQSKNLDPEKEMIVKDQLSRVMKIVNNLPENHRTVIQLRDVEGYSYKEICQMTGYTIEKVKVYLHRARTKLKQQLINID